MFMTNLQYAVKHAAPLMEKYEIVKVMTDVLDFMKETL
jgi:hypothetical protein